MEQKYSCLEDVAIVLPSLNPDHRFKAVADGLIEAGFRHIVVVDDGSDDAHKHWFDALRASPVCHVLVHEVNKGKGRALKDAFVFVHDNLPELRGVVTIDGDGQHLLGDIIACGERMLKEGDKVVMGCRDFSHPDVPPRSVAGNRFTAAMFRLCYGIRITDTQTGLRAIPAQYLERFANIEGERFEYETNMLLQMKRMGIGFVEQPIETVYDKEEYSSHYNALRDSWRIFKVMAKFLLSSGAAFLIDTGIFYVLMKLFAAKWGAFAPSISLLIARVISSFVNFNANKSFVFQSKAGYKRAMLRYYILCVIQYIVNAALTNGLVALAGRAAGHAISAGLATLIQIAVMTVLFFISYPIQREWVFSEKK